MKHGSFIIHRWLVPKTLPMPDQLRPNRSWAKKFRDAFRGVAVGVRGERSFRVHFVATVAVIVAGLLMGVARLEWCLLVLSIAVVLTAEMFNSALERMSRAITEEHDSHLADALDAGSAAVLLAAIGAAVVGGIVFLNRLSILAGWRG
jgi:diacylglycerol kinase